MRLCGRSEHRCGRPRGHDADTALHCVPFARGECRGIERASSQNSRVVPAVASRRARPTGVPNALTRCSSNARSPVAMRVAAVLQASGTAPCPSGIHRTAPDNTPANDNWRKTAHKGQTQQQVRKHSARMRPAEHAERQDAWRRHTSRGRKRLQQLPHAAQQQHTALRDGRHAHNAGRIREDRRRTPQAKQDNCGCPAGALKDAGHAVCPPAEGKHVNRRT